MEHGVQTNRKNGVVGARQNRTWRVPTQELARQLLNWRANFAVGARQVPSWRANFDLASKKPTYCNISTRQRNHKL